MLATAVSLSGACYGTVAASAECHTATAAFLVPVTQQRRGVSEALRPLTPRASRLNSAFGASVAASVTPATAVPGGADSSDSQLSLPLFIRDHWHQEVQCLFLIPTISFFETLFDQLIHTLRWI